MTSVKLLLVAVAATVLAACSSSPRSGYLTPASSPSTIQPAAAGGAATGGANTGGTYPYGTVPATGSALSAATDAVEPEAIVLKGPDGTVWIKSGAATEPYRADVDACYAFARARVAHDARIESDMNAAFESSASGLGLAELRGRMNNFERTQRRPALFNDCMAAKGYTRR